MNTKILFILFGWFCIFAKGQSMIIQGPKVPNDMPLLGINQPQDQGMRPTARGGIPSNTIPLPSAGSAAATFTVLPVHVARPFPIPVHVAVPVAVPVTISHLHQQQQQQQQALTELLHHLRQLNNRPLPIPPHSPTPIPPQSPTQTDPNNLNQFQHLFQLYSA